MQDNLFKLLKNFQYHKFQNGIQNAMPLNNNQVMITEASNKPTSCIEARL